MKAVLLFAAAAFALSACAVWRAGDQADGPNLPPELATPVAAAQEGGLTVYWLGERLEVDGLLFRAVAADLEEDNGTASLHMDYEAKLEDGGYVVFALSISPGGRYEEATDRQLSRPGQVTRHDTTVSGWRGALFETAYGGFTYRAVIVEAPESLVLAIANPSTAGGRQVNPLYYPERMLAVLENLRPYPE